MVQKEVHLSIYYQMHYPKVLSLDLMKNYPLRAILIIGLDKPTSITLQAQSDKADLVVDDNFKLDSYLFNLETAKENTKVTIYCGSQDSDQVKAMFNATNQIELETKSGYPKESSGGGGVSKGLIIGIVVAVVNISSNKEIMNRSLIIYVLLCLSNHIGFGDIKVELNYHYYKKLIFINPIYMSKFPNCPRLTNI